MEFKTIKLAVFLFQFISKSDKFHTGLTYHKLLREWAPPSSFFYGLAQRCTFHRGMSCLYKSQSLAKHHYKKRYFIFTLLARHLFQQSTITTLLWLQVTGRGCTQVHTLAHAALLPDTRVSRLYIPWLQKKPPLRESPIHAPCTLCGEKWCFTQLSPAAPSCQPKQVKQTSVFYSNREV